MSYTKIALGLVLGASVATFMAAPASATNTDHKVGICHATGSTKNPYVYIVVDKHAAEAHKQHQDGRDIIGVSSKDACPKTAVTATPKPTPAGSTLGTSTQTPGKGGEVQPATLPETGAEQLSMLIGLPAMAAAGAAYLRSRKA